MRKSLVRRGVAAALASVIGLSTVVLAAAPAQAAISMNAWLSATSLVIDGDAGCGDRTKLTVEVLDPANDEDEVWDITGYVTGPDGDYADIVFPTQTSRRGDYVYYTDYVNLCGWGADPGRYQVRVAFKWNDANYNIYSDNAYLPFTVKRPTSLSYNATPEPVKKGSKLTHTGQVKFDPFGYGAKYGAKGVTVRFYFKANGAKSYVYKGQTVTGANGKYSKKIVATKSGLWKAVYAGSGTRQAQVKYDGVKVK